MSTQLGSEPAYPCDGPNCVAYGLTIRQEFAKAAMQGLLANPQEEAWHSTAERIARIAIEHADALLAALAKQDT